MNNISSENLIQMFRYIAEAIETEKDRLCELDGIIGDGDHGIAMSVGMSAVTVALDAVDSKITVPTEIFNLAAKSFLNAVGASSGPLYATGFIRAGACIRGKTVLERDEMVAIIDNIAQGIRERGKGELGEKTMLDAWLPAAAACKDAASNDEDLSGCLRAAVKAAVAGAEETKGMLASKGRASRLGERAIGQVDPGAVSAVVILKAIARFDVAERDGRGIRDEPLGHVFN
ncbi:dihydroxyacetone kinase [Rhizobium sp. Root1203]|uniref:dihydroxyacetone kinase subunit DhaL n=1 Tax=Rhizobium sp. Root1203 TaxID=1736427 RepID=UPI00070F1CB2|nr:dihydroxyacetone kinase subunit DhaL [Rhizobium sp. Root1203]KQV14330.1 dihydroxyacetone kinase [Rhizobium sp. Root1203]